ncbi:MAG: substrate-binding domain-containing protein [Chloroflexota bacterium]
MISTTPRRLAALAVIASVALTACSSGGASIAPSAAAATNAASGADPSATTPSTSASRAPAGSMAGVTGTINVSGSSTVEPISTAVAQLVKAANPGFNYTVTGPGTGDGFKTFCKGETDISDASRKIKDEEAATCAAAGIEYTELKIAYDGMTVMTSPDNAAVTCLSFADLYALTGPQSQGFDKWSSAQDLAKSLGSNTAFPDADLSITGPGEESGTYDSYVELVIAPIASAQNPKQESATRPDYVASANDNSIIAGVEGSQSSLGWVGFAFAQENKDKIKEVAVSKAPNGDCVQPTDATIADGTYPLSRSLYIYVNKAKAAANPAVAGYVDFYLADGTISKVLETVPYVNLPADALAATQKTWSDSD